MEDVIEWNEDKESPVSIRDVCNEFNQIRKNYGIKEFRAKPVKRKYCFNLPNVPREEREYVKIQFKNPDSRELIIFDTSDIYSLK